MVHKNETLFFFKASCTRVHVFLFVKKGCCPVTDIKT